MTHDLARRVRALLRRPVPGVYLNSAAEGLPLDSAGVAYERYLDANSAGFVDSTGKPATVPASGDTTGLALGPYRFRVVSSKQFAP